MTVRYEDWGRRGLMAVAREIPGLGYGAAALGIRRFRMQLPQDSKKAQVRRARLSKLSKVKI